MSRELMFEERKPNEWWVVLEHAFGDLDPWDWTEQADHYGPFATLDAAHEHYETLGVRTSGSETRYFEPTPDIGATS